MQGGLIYDECENGISLGKMAIFVLTQIWQTHDEISIVMLIMED